MGGGNWSDDSYSTLKSSYSTKTTKQIFTNNDTDKDMSPIGVKFRESRDSDAHPNSIAIMVNLDVTGSMGKIPEILVREKLGALMTTLIAHDVPDAHVMFAAIGDQFSDNSPLQVGQFEAGTEELNKWLTKIFIEEGGGAQNRESYELAWLFAARHTSIDCFEKRGEKGFLFTIGDEATWDKLEPAAIKRIMGYDSETITTAQLLAEAQRMYHVFHLHIKQGYAGSDPQVIQSWKDMLGEGVIFIEDYNTIAEVIASTVAVVRGADLSHVVSTFDKTTAGHVTTALAKISSSAITSNKSTEGVVKL